MSDREATRQDVELAMARLKQRLSEAREDIRSVLEMTEAFIGSQNMLLPRRDSMTVLSDLNRVLGVDFYGTPCGSVLRWEDTIAQECLEAEHFTLERQADRADAS